MTRLDNEAHGQRSFQVVVRTPGAQKIVGLYQCRIHSGGITLESKKEQDIAIPIGTNVKLAEQTKFLAQVEEEWLEIEPHNFSYSRKRLAADLAAFLNNEIEMPVTEDYRVVADSLNFASLLPYFVCLLSSPYNLLLNLTGILLSSGCFRIAMIERWSTIKRLALILFISLATFAVLNFRANAQGFQCQIEPDYSPSLCSAQSAAPRTPASSSSLAGTTSNVSR